jgi:hypothetical protein
MCRQFARGPVTRRILAAVAAAVFLLVAPSDIAAPANEDLPNGRLGYRWTPDPSTPPTSRESQIAWNVAKYGGGGIAALWLLRKLATPE